jgi:hypothetical protein
VLLLSLCLVVSIASPNRFFYLSAGWVAGRKSNEERLYVQPDTKTTTAQQHNNKTTRQQQDNNKTTTIQHLTLTQTL